MIQPFERIEGLDSMKYTAIFVSDSDKKETPDRERFNVFIEIDPWNKIVKHSCECKGFKYSKGKKVCKHISSEGENPGILQILKQWGEIEEIPEIEDVLE